MTVSLSIAGLHAHAAEGPWRAGPRAALEWAGGLGFRALHLDAAAPGVRPRELDRSARRDLAATLRRLGLGFTGLDLWIPAEHYADAARADRALAALLGAIDLAADLAGLTGGDGPVVSATLPEAFDGLDAVAARADTVGVVVEDYAQAFAAGAAASGDGSAAGGAAGVADGIAGERPSTIRPGLDTGRLILRERPPGKTFAAASKQLATLRLNDADDTGRRPMGAGRLEVAMLIALHATLTPRLPIVTDLRGLDNPERGAAAALDVLSAEAM